MEKLLKGTLYFYSDRKPVEVKVIEEGKSAIAYELDHVAKPGSVFGDNDWEVLNKRTGKTYSLVGNKYINGGSDSKRKYRQDRGIDFIEGEPEYYYDGSF